MATRVVTRKAPAVERVDARTQELSGRLLDAASRFFLEKGFEASSIGEIARYAHASKETFYRHFSTKEQLFRAVVMRRAEHMAREFSAVLAPHDLPTKALHRFGQVILDRVITPEAMALHRVLLMERVRFPDLNSSFHQQGPAKVHAALTSYLKQQVKRGVLRKHNSSVAARQLFDLVAAEMTMRAWLGTEHEATPAQRKQRVKEAVDCFLYGYASRPAARPKTEQVTASPRNRAGG